MPVYITFFVIISVSLCRLHFRFICQSHVGVMSVSFRIHVRFMSVSCQFDVGFNSVSMHVFMSVSCQFHFFSFICEFDVGFISVSILFHVCFISGSYRFQIFMSFSCRFHFSFMSFSCRQFISVHFRCTLVLYRIDPFHVGFILISRFHVEPITSVSFRFPSCRFMSVSCRFRVDFRFGFTTPVPFRHSFTLVSFRFHVGCTSDVGFIFGVGVFY